MRKSLMAVAALVVVLLALTVSLATPGGAYDRRRPGNNLSALGARALSKQSVPRHSRPASSPPVIAVIEDGGVNVLHKDFALASGERLVLPRSMPTPQWVSLPTSGSFEQRLEKVRSGPLGSLKGGRMYWLKRTRIGVFVPKGSDGIDVLGNRFHATGTTSSAVGLKHGTNPSALVVFIPDADDRAWEWLSHQNWIDIVSTSYIHVAVTSEARCPDNAFIKKIAESGRLVFSGAGNAEQVGIAFTPSGSPLTYQVGGVDDEGRTYIPSPDNDGIAVTPTRPYETGDRFDFPAADSDSLKGSMEFGGTSGATPSTAGRAAELLQFARKLLGSTWTGVRRGALAVATKGSKVPKKGPLADGRLEREEFVDLLHHVAIPAEPAFPGRYLLEGYGALSDKAIELAKRVLVGKADEPQRPQEDTMHETIESARPLLFPQGRGC